MFQQAYSDEAMDCMKFFQWHRHFNPERMFLEDNERSGRPATCITLRNVEKIHQLLHEDCQRTSNDIANVVGLSYGSVQAFLTSGLNTQYVYVKFVSCLLTTEQKEHLVEICQDLHQPTADDSSFILRIISGERSWGCGYDPEMKQQSQWKSLSSA
ncbi:protein GVQW3-like [Octopus bimaculoides]|uniref:protein GVQW3-like n=1 Tax=Octopus bimaculoides TaxID=37653 RepID=UPI00071D4DB3|nr:protein GVQW3-like [Octopus bimaculoides]|eukprot:XP_014775261.1 PREDICTED: putative uncharacterized protein FLJ37770 [Octopus bimaculoides]